MTIVDWVNLGSTAFGTTLSVIGLIVAITQIRKARSAAEAAANAAREVEIRLRGLTTLIEISRLTTQSGQLILLLRAGNYAGAAQRGLDLREGVAAARSAAHSATLLEANQWQRLVYDVSTLHDQLEDCVHKQPSEKSARAAMRHASSIHERVSDLHGRAHHLT